MGKLLLILLLLGSFLPLKAEVKDIKNLITVTERTLERQKSFLHELEEYYRIKNLFIEDCTNKELGADLIRSARGVQEHIDGFSTFLSADLVEEIAFFAGIGA